MPRISKQTKAIADAHIASVLSGKWTGQPINTTEEFISNIRAGQTYDGAVAECEKRWASITSTISARRFGYISHQYRAAIYKGFRILLDN